MPLTLPTFFTILLIGLLGAIGNLALFQAANNAPNAGLAIAIGAGMQSAVVTVLAAIFLRDKITLLQIAGIILSILAILFINLGTSFPDNSKRDNLKKESSKVIVK